MVFNIDISTHGSADVRLGPGLIPTHRSLLRWTALKTFVPT
jgi:hypothetical protein